MRLRRSACDGPGLRRVRRGRGFGYLDEQGDRVTDPALLDRVRTLAIPPAWQEVWICPHDNGHIQAVGKDAAGRRQYIYHEAWRSRRDEEKHQRVLALARRLPKVRERIHQDLVLPGLVRPRVVAGALRILDRGVFRVGGEEYAEDSRGVATLLRRDVRVRGKDLNFHFTAKGGIDRTANLTDLELAALVKSLRRGKQDDDRLFAHNGYEVHADDVNERFKQLAGSDFTVKDMRTWTATVLAATEYAAHDLPSSKTAAKRLDSQVMKAVSEQLGNTPTIARKSYVDPRVVEAFHAGHSIAPTLRRLVGKSPEEIREPLERAVIRLLTAL
ncbi:DNA topoisomerase IB [Actinokineospora bangkokensis]|uniref:DNA topoisomerase n=1 Tax=Actinokineospora bangkokensis TaxID=1193682 RepID=A0A1Q9LJ69_9PSEU|nr:DNA topoisomerase IB [Actinokineospora bangkokensis]OLR92045.1 DNA topoisomerase [Actinokineospora bangkokensis]